jgi:hypothetical protein
VNPGKCHREGCNATLRFIEQTADTFELQQWRYECRGKERHQVTITSESRAPRQGVKGGPPVLKVGAHFTARAAAGTAVR